MMSPEQTFDEALARFPESYGAELKADTMTLDDVFDLWQQYEDGAFLTPAEVIAMELVIERENAEQPLSGKLATISRYAHNRAWEFNQAYGTLNPDQTAGWDN